MNGKCALGAFLSLICAFRAVSEIPIGGFGSDDFDLDCSTIFVGDLNDGSTGLETIMRVGFWFEPIGYQDRGIAPRKDTLSVSLKLANSVFYSWRGYTIDSDSTSATPLYVTDDQIIGIRFDSFIVELQYGQYWFRVAGTEPTLTISLASLRSVFDEMMDNTTAGDKNSFPLPLFYTSGAYTTADGVRGIVSVIGRDLVSLDERDVELYGMYSTGITSEGFSADLKVGSWKNGEDNDKNSWVFGADAKYKLSVVSTIEFSSLYALNYDGIAYADYDGDGVYNDSTTINEDPLALGLSYDHRIDLPGMLALKPYLGVDVLMPTVSDMDMIEDLRWEIGGGLCFFFRGTGARFKRNTFIGGDRLGDVENDVGFFVAANIDQDHEVNMILSANEDPNASPIKNFGGFFQIEGMNMLARNGKPRLIAGVVQLEYQIAKSIMPYVFEKYIPGYTVTGLTDHTHAFDTKFGVRCTPIDYFAIDFWYERNDSVDENGNFDADKGLISMLFNILL